MEPLHSGDSIEHLDLSVRFCLLRGKYRCLLIGSRYLSVYMPQIIGDAEAEYMAFFAWKTNAMIRAPDSYAYPAPFNLVETFIAPLE